MKHPGAFKHRVRFQSFHALQNAVNRSIGLGFKQANLVVANHCDQTSDLLLNQRLLLRQGKFTVGVSELSFHVTARFEFVHLDHDTTVFVSVLETVRLSKGVGGLTTDSRRCLTTE